MSEATVQVSDIRHEELCANCKKQPATTTATFGQTRGGDPITMLVCEDCAPVENPAPKKKRKKTKNRRAETDYTETVEALLYRTAGGTADQVARWLVQLSDDFEDRKVNRYDSALMVARKTLRTMREAGVVEAISVRRTWDRKRAMGRREDFYRLRREGDGVIDAALLADVDGDKAKAGYRRPWLGGGHTHAAHRNDFFLLLLEESEVLETIFVDPEACFSESHPSYPLVGYQLPQVDAGGEDKPERDNARRKYELVVPDGEMTVVWEDAMEYPPDASNDEDDLRATPDDAYAEDTDSYADTGEEVYA